MAAKKAKDPRNGVVAQNRRARHDYTIEDTEEAGIVLTGTEVKSLREGRASLTESFVSIDKHNEMWLEGANIPEYLNGTWNNHMPKRKRKLLLHAVQIEKFARALQAKGYTIVPLSLYFKNGRAKVEIALAKGKREYDKRQALKEAQDKREALRAMREHNLRQNGSAFIRLKMLARMRKPSVGKRLAGKRSAGITFTRCEKRMRIGRFMVLSSGLKRAGRAVMATVVALAACTSLMACGTSDGLDAQQANIDLSDVHENKQLAAMVSPEVSHDGVLTVGSNATWAPAEFTGEENETVIGFDIDIIKAVAKVLGLKVKVVDSAFATIIPSVGSKFDVGISGFTITAEREKAVTFVQHYSAGMSYAVRAGNPKNIDSDNLCGVRASVQVGTAEETALEDSSVACVKAGKPAIALQVYEQQTQATTALITGRSDVMYSDTPVSAYAVKQTKGKLELLGKPYDIAPQGIVVKKGDDKTAHAIQGALQELIDSGVYMRILKAWGVEDGAIDKAVINPKVD